MPRVGWRRSRGVGSRIGTENESFQCLSDACLSFRYVKSRILVEERDHVLQGRGGLLANSCKLITSKGGESTYCRPVPEPLLFLQKQDSLQERSRIEGLLHLLDGRGLASSGNLTHCR